MPREETGRPYRAPADVVTPRQRKAAEKIAATHDWAETRYYADGTAEVLVLDARGIIQQIITVLADGTIAPEASR